MDSDSDSYYDDDDDDDDKDDNEHDVDDYYSSISSSSNTNNQGGIQITQDKREVNHQVILKKANKAEIGQSVITVYNGNTAFERSVNNL